MVFNLHHQNKIMISEHITTIEEIGNKTDMNANDEWTWKITTSIGNKRYPDQ